MGGSDYNSRLFDRSASAKITICPSFRLAQWPWPSALLLPLLLRKNRFLAQMKCLAKISLIRERALPPSPRRLRQLDQPRLPHLVGSPSQMVTLALPAAQLVELPLLIQRSARFLLRP